MKTIILTMAALTFLGVRGNQETSPAPERNTKESVLTLDDAAFEKAFARVPSGHPKLFGGEAEFTAMKERLGKDTLFTAAATAIRNQADHYASFGTGNVLERKIYSRRLLSVCRKALSRISKLAMAYRLFGDRKYLDRCILEMKTVCAFEDWNPRHFLDVGEMSLAVAIGYDWLYGYLSPEDRETFAAALESKGLRTCLETSARKKRNPLRARNNWGPVCNGGAVAAALALWDRNNDEARQMIKWSVKQLPAPMAVYAPKGSYPEGPGYWSYGTSFNVMMIALLEHACGTDFGLPTIPGFLDTGIFRDIVTGPTGQMFNFADSGLKRSLDTSPWWFAHYSGEPTAIDWFERSALIAVSRDKRAYVPRMFACALFWIRDMPPKQVETRPFAWNSEDETGIAVLRDKWTADGWFAAFRYGYVGGQHGHLDTGSFILDAEGVRWAGDIGGVNYARVELLGINLWNRKQGSDRWKLYNLNSESHNLIVPQGVWQKVGNSGKMESIRENPQGGGAVSMNLDAVFAPEMPRWRRKAELLPQGAGFIVEDEAVTAPGIPLSWGFATQSSAEVQGDGVILTTGNKKMRVTAELPAAVRWEVVPARGNGRGDQPNKGWSRVLFRYPDGSNAASRVRFTLVKQDS